MNNVAVGQKKKKKLPIKLLIGLFLVQIGWFLPYGGLSLTLLPARIGVIDPVHKVQWIAVFTSFAMVSAAIANLVAGALSDRTRTRIGKRTPWLIGGTILSVILIALISVTTNIKVLLACWTLYQAAMNAVVAAGYALLADMVNPNMRGTASTCMGLGTTVGNYGSGLIAAHFIIHFQYGAWLFAVLMVILEFAAILLVREPGNQDEPKPVKVKKLMDAIKIFSLPTKGAHDFYWALSGRFMMVTGTHMILGYQLYIFTDYMMLGSKSTTTNISLVSSIMMIAGIIMGIIGGPLSDKLGHYKIPVVITTFIVAAGAFTPFIAAKPWTMLVFATMAGLAMGAYNSIDQALLISILPNKDERAKDLGILNLSNTLGNMMGPILASAVISVVGYRLLFPAEMIICILSGLAISRIKSAK